MMNRITFLFLLALMSNGPLYSQILINENLSANRTLILGESDMRKNLNISSDDTRIAYITRSASETKVTFSEINYHSDISSDAGDWLELHNYGDSQINLTGWYIKKGNNTNLYQIPFGAVIPAKGYLVLSSDTQKFSLQHPYVKNFKGPLPFNFSNSGDKISLLDYDFKTVISVTYSDEPPWPKEADGKGYTLELFSYEKSLDLGTNWFAGCPGGSPGIAYNPQCLTGVEEKVDKGALQVHIWPNPSNGMVRISAESATTPAKGLSLTLYDFIGNEVKSMPSLANNEFIISRSEFSPGIYIVRISNGRNSITKKLILTD